MGLIDYIDRSPDCGARRLHSIGVGFLKSYAGMGRVRVDCRYDCACASLTLDGHHTERISPLDLTYIAAR
eukprot:6432926-Prymnesium_polylepis.1